MKIVADNFTVSNPTIYSKLQSFDALFFENLFREILKNTNLLDLNFGQLKKNIKETVKFVFEILNSFNESITVFIDTVNVEIIEECLKYTKNPPVINAISYDEYKIDKIVPVAASNGLKVVALLIDKNVPLSVEEKTELALKIVDVLISKGISFENIIVDPVVVPLGWDKGAEYNKNNLEFLKIKSEIFSDEIKVMMGISNLTTGATGKNRSVKGLDGYYLSMAYSIGLDYALVNVFNSSIKTFTLFMKTLENNLIFSPEMFKIDER